MWGGGVDGCGGGNRGRKGGKTNRHRIETQAKIDEAMLMLLIYWNNNEGGREWDGRQRHGGVL